MGSASSFPLASWLNDLRRLPATASEVEQRVCRPLQALLGAEWVGCALTGVPHQGFPERLPAALAAVVPALRPGALDFTRQTIDGRALLVVPFSEGWLAAWLKNSAESGDGSELLAVAVCLEGLRRETDARTDLRLREQFLSIASHELKTPLTSIYGILQLQERMMRSLAWPAELRGDQERHLSFLQLVIRQTERMTEMIDGLLDVSRIQAGKFTVEAAEVNPGKIIRELAGGRLDLLPREAGVQILLDLPESASARLDSTRFEEVVSNLVMNALRLSPEGGVIWVRLRFEGADLVVSVRDQGLIISDEDRVRVFEPFERARAVARMGGLGLGLYISRWIARLHGGDVVLLPSGAARGNIFEARFPVSGPPKSPVFSRPSVPLQ